MRTGRRPSEEQVRGQRAAVGRMSGERNRKWYDARAYDDIEPLSLRKK